MKEPPTSSKEELILAAAEEVFVEKGLTGTRMQEIADRAGINKTLLHYYFRSKENIYRRILERVFGEFFQRIEESFAENRSFAETLEGFINSVTDYVASEPRVPLFIMQELARGGGVVRDVFISAIESSEASLPVRFIALIRREQEIGTIEEVDPIQLILTLVGSCIYFFLAEPIIRGALATGKIDVSFERDAFVETRKREVFRTIYLGIKKREA